MDGFAALRLFGVRRGSRRSALPPGASAIPARLLHQGRLWRSGLQISWSQIWGETAHGKAAQRSKRYSLMQPGERRRHRRLNSECSPSWRAVPTAASRRSSKPALTDSLAVTGPLGHRLLSQQVLQPFSGGRLGGHRMAAVRGRNCSPPSGNWSRPPCEPRTCWWAAPWPSELAAGFPTRPSLQGCAGGRRMTWTETSKEFG